MITKLIKDKSFNYKKKDAMLLIKSLRLMMLRCLKSH